MRPYVASANEQRAIPVQTARRTDRLQTLHSGLGEDSQAELKIGGNNYFGWRFTITFFRELTQEEAALEAKNSLPRFGRGSRRRMPQMGKTVCRPS